MADPEDPRASRTFDVRRLSSGYDPEAGLAAHQADAPTRIPVPSLLRALLRDHLDPGYAAAAERRDDGQGRGRLGEWAWQLLAVVLIAAVFAAAAAQARSAASGTEQTQQALVGSVQTAEATAEEVTARRDALAGAVDEERRNRLEGDERGRELLGRLDEANFTAAVTPVIGPGLTVTVTDPGASNDLSDVSQRRVAGSPQVILDRDLQLVVNSLWASGAEALAVDGVRIGPNVTIRQAGGGILVDNNPITSPYEIIAIGPPSAMQDVFERTPGLHRLRLLETAYGAGATVTKGEGLMAPAGSVREVNFAMEFDP